MRKNDSSRTARLQIVGLNEGRGKEIKWDIEEVGYVIEGEKREVKELGQNQCLK